MAHIHEYERGTIDKRYIVVFMSHPCINDHYQVVDTWRDEEVNYAYDVDVDHNPRFWSFDKSACDKEAARLNAENIRVNS